MFVSIVFLYGSGAFILSLLNLKPHLMAKLMPFSDQVASHFLELPRLEVKEVRGVGERERYLFEERRGFGERVEFERIELPIVPRVGLSFVNLFKLLSLPFLLLLIFILSLFLRNFEFLVDLGLVGVVLVVFVWYFVYMLVSLDREEQVYSTSLVLSVFVIVSSFIVVYYLVGVHLAGANSFDVGFLRLQFVVSGLVALSSALVVVELPGYLVLSGIKERKIESLRADIDKLNRELGRLLSELEAYSHSSGREGIARVNVLREHIRITMSKKSFLEEEIIRVENESSSPVPLLDKVLSGGLLGLIVALFTILAG